MEKKGQQVANTLLARIVDGAYGSEGRIPSERELTSQMDASRASVREALQTLVQWCVLEIRPGSGALVKPMREWRLDVLQLYSSETGMSLRQDEGLLEDMMELRRGFYGDVAERLGSRGVSPHALTAARKAVQKAWTCKDDPALFGLLELDVMRRLLEAAAMLPSMWMLNQLAAVYGPAMQSRASSIEVPELFMEAHEAFFEALEKRSPQEARMAVEEYLDGVEKAYLTEAA